jgi:hypothetical protein
VQLTKRRGFHIACIGSEFDLVLFTNLLHVASVLGVAGICNFVIATSSETDDCRNCCWLSLQVFMSQVIIELLFAVKQVFNCTLLHWNGLQSQLVSTSSTFRLRRLEWIGR